MIPPTQITDTEIFAFIAVLVFKVLGGKDLFIDGKDNRIYLKVGCFLRENSKLHGQITAK